MEQSRINQLTLIRYKGWADALLYGSLSNLSEYELVKNRSMLFGNIPALLNHVYSMDVAWKCNLQNIGHKFKTRNPNDVPDFRTLRQRQFEINAWYESYAAKLTDSQLSTEVEFSFIGGREGNMKIGEILQHVVNHASYHRGHIEGVMYQLSMEPPTTDIPVFMRIENRNR